jgi:hypothetical protein
MTRQRIWPSKDTEGEVDVPGGRWRELQGGEQVLIEKKAKNQPLLVACLRLGFSYSCWLRVKLALISVALRLLYLFVIIPKCTLLTLRGELARFRFKTAVRCLLFQ